MHVDLSYFGCGVSARSRGIWAGHSGARSPYVGGTIACPPCFEPVGLLPCNGKIIVLHGYYLTLLNTGCVYTWIKNQISFPRSMRRSVFVCLDVESGTRALQIVGAQAAHKGQIPPHVRKYVP